MSARIGTRLAALLVERHGLGERTRPVVGVAGESGSGKTSAARDLARALGSAGLPAALLHQDDYFRLPPHRNHDHRVADLAHVGPHEVNLELMAAHIAAFRDGRDGVVAPMVDYPSDAFRERRLDFADRAVLVVEGTYALQLDAVDVGIFLTATHVETRERRLRRNRDVHTPIIDRILAIEHEIIAPQRERAAIVVDREFAIVSE